MDMLMIGIRKFVSYQNFADMFTLKVLIISGHVNRITYVFVIQTDSDIKLYFNSNSTHNTLQFWL